MKEAERKKSKLQSRKFFAWIVATAILVYLFIASSEHIPVFMPWWGGITMVWLGVEGGADIMGARK